MADEIRNGGSKMRVVVRLLGIATTPVRGDSRLPRAWCGRDVCYRSIKRVATAAGEGAMAIAFVHRCLEETA